MPPSLTSWNQNNLNKYIVTLAQIEVGTLGALKPDSPNWFDATVVTRPIEMDDILVSLIQYLEEVFFVLVAYTLLAQIIICHCFWLVSLAIGL